jgi:hypothetical protein
LSSASDRLRKSHPRPKQKLNWTASRAGACTVGSKFLVDYAKDR